MQLTQRGQEPLCSHIVKAAKEVLKGIYHQGYLYKRAGVIVLGMPSSMIFRQLFCLFSKSYYLCKEYDE
ncbi:MAG: hypothetical protein IKI06_01570 [Prevotella sp.]|nr:hypothetical protein [Prevotella sp.]